VLDFALASPQSFFPPSHQEPMFNMPHLTGLVQSPPPSSRDCWAGAGFDLRPVEMLTAKFHPGD